MADAASLSPEADDGHHTDPPSADGVPPPGSMHAVSTYTTGSMHMYPFGPSLVPSQPQMRSKRRQVKNACTNCQKACKKCDDARPCLRCVKYGIGEECVDSQRKERKRGKRGPYKKRDGKTSPTVEPPLDGQMSQAMSTPPTPQHPAQAMTYAQPLGYVPAFYGQYHSGPKLGDPPAYYPHPHYYIPLPPAGHEHEHLSYPPPHQFYPPPPPFVSYPGYMPSYIIPHPRPDTAAANPSYASYPPMYQRPPSVADDGVDMSGSLAHAGVGREGGNGGGSAQYEGDS